MWDPPIAPTMFGTSETSWNVSANPGFCFCNREFYVDIPQVEKGLHDVLDCLLIFQHWNLAQYFHNCFRAPDNTNQVRVLFLERCSHAILYFCVLWQVTRHSTTYQRYDESFAVVFWNTVGEFFGHLVDLEARLVWSWKFLKVGVALTCPVSLSSTVFNH